MARETFAGRIRQAAIALSVDKASFTASELSIKAGLQSRHEERNMASALRDFMRSGEVIRDMSGTGGFVYLGKARRKKLPLKDQMRNLLKIKKFVTVDDLRELGAAESYALEWLRMLVNRGVVRKHDNGRYGLIADMAIPENEKKAERLRRIRQQQKEIKGMLESIGDKLEQILEMVTEL